MWQFKERMRRTRLEGVRKAPLNLWVSGCGSGGCRCCVFFVGLPANHTLAHLRSWFLPSAVLEQWPAGGSDSKSSIADSLCVGS